MVEIVVYDDPLNPHGWGFEPMVRRLRVECPDAAWEWQPVVLVPDWDQYDGPEFPRGRQRVPATCSKVSEESGMPIDEYLWFDDPPTSSRPACVGIGTVTESGTQSRATLMRAAREATFLRQTNLDSMDAVRELVAATLGADTADAVPETSDVAGSAWTQSVERADGGRDVRDVAGVETVGDRPRLPTVVVRDGDAEEGVSGRVDVGVLRELVASVTGADPQPQTLEVEAAIDRFSPEGWLCGTELVAVTGRPYREVMTAAQDLGEVQIAEFAAETFVRADDN